MMTTTTRRMRGRTTKTRTRRTTEDKTAEAGDDDNDESVAEDDEDNDDEDSGWEDDDDDLVESSGSATALDENVPGPDILLVKSESTSDSTSMPASAHIHCTPHKKGNDLLTAACFAFLLSHGALSKHVPMSVAVYLCEHSRRFSVLHACHRLQAWMRLQTQKQ